MKTIYPYLLTISMGAIIVTGTSSCSKTDDTTTSTSNLPSECTSILADLEGTHTLTAGNNTGGPGDDFGNSSTYDVVVLANGKISIQSDNSPIVFEGSDITSCEELQHESNVYYDKSGLMLIVQVEGESITLVLYDSNGQITLSYSPGPDVSLIVTYAGTYPVTAVSKGSHSRMSVTIGSDGSIDFDSGISYTANDYQLISDRLDCCQAVYIDCAPYPSEPYPRITIETNSYGEIIGMSYNANYPNSGGTSVAF